MILSFVVYDRQFFSVTVYISVWYRFKIWSDFKSCVVYSSLKSNGLLLWCFLWAHHQALVTLLCFPLKKESSIGMPWVNKNRLFILSMPLTSVNRLYRMSFGLLKSNKPHCERQPNSYQTVWAWLIFTTWISSIREEQCAIFNTLNSSAQECLCLCLATMAMKSVLRNFYYENSTYSLAKLN